MRCPDCNKFVALDFQEPELDSIEVDCDVVRATVRLVRCCADCGGELKEANLDLEFDLPGEFAEEHRDHELEVEDTGIEQIEEGGGRYAKSYFGAVVLFTVTCSCGATFEGEMSDKIAASYMEELV
jgi:hypothetical protein